MGRGEGENMVSFREKREIVMGIYREKVNNLR
jgi:hypothetical protein